MRSRPVPSYFYSLDVLRFFAAIAVVFFHWRHFFFVGTSILHITPGRQPFFRVLGVAYVDGARAVDFFFVLSGFLFFWLYSENIARRRTSARKFLVLRVSRLYPLHFATLLAVAVLQFVWRRTHPEYFVYAFNDAYHFVLQLLFISGLGLAHGLSFNGPAWTVSIEVILYAVFFIVCALNKRRVWHLLAFVAVGLYLLSSGSGLLATGVVCFFMGAIGFQLFDWLRLRGISKRNVYILAVAVLVSWIVVLSIASGNALDQSAALALIEPDVAHPGFSAQSILSSVVASWTDLLLYPATVVACALLETCRGTLGKRFAVAGTLSYSCYLLHFPLQLVFMSGSEMLGLDRSFFYSPVSLFLFFGCLIPLSYLVHRQFERPAQIFIRRRLLSSVDSARTAPAVVYPGV